MTRIPIFDATEPVTCTADRDEITARLTQLERLRTALERVERTEHGALLHFPNRSELADDVRRFAVDEQRCCRFWGFDVTTTPDEVVLRWDAPPSADELLARLLTHLEGGEPITAASGLL